jgi:hypothetical protein
MGADTKREGNKPFEPDKTEIAAGSRLTHYGGGACSFPDPVRPRHAPRHTQSMT